jgi:hypothetical protein
MKKLNLTSLLFILFLFFAFNTHGQPELQAWGNMSGIRTEGQLLKFETSIFISRDGWESFAETGKEKQNRPIYTREGALQTVSTLIDSLFISKTVQSSGENEAGIKVLIDSKTHHDISGIFFCVKVPGQDFNTGKIQLIEPSELSLNSTILSTKNDLLRMIAKGFRLIGTDRDLEVLWNEPTLIIVKNEKDDIKVYLQMHEGAATAGQILENTIKIKTTGTINRNPVTMILNTSSPGRVFDGIGGNFRLQNAKHDPMVIDYCLENLRVSWARVEMPWMLWHPNEDVNPIEAANRGELHERVKAAMEMAQRLHKMGIPVMLAAWFPPAWAAEGELNFSPQAGVWGNQLNQEKKEKIYASITDYILYMKQKYGVEMVYFSFNESDLGINVRQTDQEHTILIKELGAYFKSKGLKTKLLLGDTADANGWPFIEDAMADVAARPYMGAVSFHSWRGWEYETLNKWAAAADKMNIPLIVGEGSIDAAAWRYPGIFEEQTYALEEINLYVRILDICQPLTILQWQLTSDYSPLVGGGLFGNNEPLRPTQRFGNLKQLGATKPGLQFLSMSNDGEDISSVALGNVKKNDFAFHIVNNGATREVTIKGIPKKVKQLEVYVTDINRNMEKPETLKVQNGEVVFTLDKVSFTSLMTK